MYRRVRGWECGTIRGREGPTMNDLVQTMFGDVRAKRPGGVDVGLAERVVAESQEVLLELMQSIKAVGTKESVSRRTTVVCAGCGGKTSVPQVNVDGLARAAAQVMRTLDECARLALFCQGQPDHRVEMAGPGGQDMSWLAGLTSDQIQQVQRWVQENAAAAARPQVEAMDVDLQPEA